MEKDTGITTSLKDRYCRFFRFNYDDKTYLHK